jgi:TPR repeat protein
LNVFAIDFETTKSLAEQGDAEAQSNLGFMYYSGQGVPQNYQEAFKWNKLAAEQGEAGAQLGLGAMYYFAGGAPQNYQEATKWWILAKTSGASSEADDMLDMVTKKLTPSELQKAQEDAKKWWDEHKR